MKGFSHSYWIVEQRKLRFGPTNWIEISSQLTPLIALYALSGWIRDWRLGLAVVMVQAVTGLIVSHLIAKTPYRWFRGQEQMRAIWAFGIPLVANGALVVLTIYGDRFVLGSAPLLSPNSGITLEDIGAFNVVFGLAFTLSMGLFRIINNLVLPVLARSRNSQELLEKQILKAGLAVAFLASLIMTVALFAGPIGLRWLYGQRYDLGLLLIGLIAGGQALKLLRANANLISLALGDSRNIVWSNLVRGLGIGLAILSCVFGGGMEMIAFSGIVAEALSLILAIILLKSQQEIPLRLLLQPLAFFASAVSVVVLIRYVFDGYC
jgi:O-antigen/teichoic acid export membrane protein